MQREHISQVLATKKNTQSPTSSFGNETRVKEILCWCNPDRKEMMSTEDKKVLTLKEAVSAPRNHRDLKLAAEPMPNFKSTGKLFSFVLFNCKPKDISE